MAVLKKADFSYGVNSFDQLPDTGLFEVAVAGRSNVGKSSFINRVCQRKKLANTSSTPGRTKQFNFFTIEYEAEEATVNFELVDFPGHGYAKFSKVKRRQLSQMIVDYIINREELKVLCLLNDCRRKPEKDELALQKLAFDNGVSFVLILTKTDKLKQAERTKAIKARAKDYGLEPGDVVLTGEKVTPVPFWNRLVSLLT